MPSPPPDPDTSDPSTSDPASLDSLYLASEIRSLRATFLLLSRDPLRNSAKIANLSSMIACLVVQQTKLLGKYQPASEIVEKRAVVLEQTWFWSGGSRRTEPTTFDPGKDRQAPDGWEVSQPTNNHSPR
jgi:hypothetical protein